MYCRYCGKKLDGETIFCGKCGKRVSMEGEDFLEQPNSVVVKKNNSNGIIIGAVIILICIAVYFVNYACGIPFMQDAGTYIGKKASTISMYRYMKESEWLDGWEMQNICLMDLNTDGVVDAVTSTGNGLYKIEGVSKGMSFAEAKRTLKESYSYTDFDYNVYSHYIDDELGKVTVGYSEEKHRYILLTCVGNDVREIYCVDGYVYDLFMMR